MAKFYFPGRRVFNLFPFHLEHLQDWLFATNEEPPMNLRTIPFLEFSSYFNLLTNTSQLSQSWKYSSVSAVPQCAPHSPDPLNSLSCMHIYCFTTTSWGLARITAWVLTCFIGLAGLACRAWTLCHWGFIPVTDLPALDSLWALRLALATNVN